MDYPRPCHNITQVYCARVIWGSTCIKIFIHSQDWWRHMRLQSFNIPTFCYSINVALNKRMTSFGNWMLKTSSSFCPWTKIKPLWKYKWLDKFGFSYLNCMFPNWIYWSLNLQKRHMLLLRTVSKLYII